MNKIFPLFCVSVRVCAFLTLIACRTEDFSHPFTHTRPHKVTLKLGSREFFPLEPSNDYAVNGVFFSLLSWMHPLKWVQKVPPHLFKSHFLGSKCSGFFLLSILKCICMQIGEQFQVLGQSYPNESLRSNTLLKWWFQLFFLLQRIFCSDDYVLEGSFWVSWSTDVK